jgi:hypothetical protein
MHSLPAYESNSRFSDAQKDVNLLLIAAGFGLIL